MLLVLLTVVLAIAVDQLTKYIMGGLLPDLPGQTMPVIRDVLHFTYVENEGAAFGMLENHRWIFMVLSVLGLALIALLVVKEKPESPWVRLAAGLVLGGGIGNMVDRLGFGFAETKYAVLDFIDCRFINFYVFNVADACVTVGCFLYLFLVIVSEIRAAREKKKAPVPASGEETDADGSTDGGTDETADSDSADCESDDTAENDTEDGGIADVGVADGEAPVNGTADPGEDGSHG